MAAYKFIDFSKYTSLAPGTWQALDGEPGMCVWRRKLPPDRQGKEPLERQFNVTTCRRAMAWANLEVRNTLASEALAARANQTGQIAANPSGQTHPNEENLMAFDPVAELIKEFGPSARLGEALPSGAPEYDSTYPASMNRGPYGLSTAAYGARSSLPVNRRNPNPDRPKQSREANRKEFGTIARNLGRIQAQRKDATGRTCSLAEAWAILKEQQGGGAAPISLGALSKSAGRQLSAAEEAALLPAEMAEEKLVANPAPASPAQAAARARFAAFSRQAQQLQRERGCSPKEAWAIAREMYAQGQLKNNPSAWNTEFARLARAAFAHLQTVKDKEGRSCSLSEAWQKVYPASERGTKHGKAWTAKFEALVREVAAFQRQRGCSLKEAWSVVYPRAVEAKSNPAGEFDQNPDWAPGGSYVDYVDQDMYGYQAPASPPNEPWDWGSQYETRVGAYGPAAQFPPVNRRNPARRNPTNDYVKWSNMDLVELSNRGDEDASAELARREQNREAKNNPRARRNG